MPELVTTSSRLNADRFFQTAHLHADLKGRSIRGGALTFLAQVAKFVIQIGSTPVLARLLTPADFGLVAMVSAVTGLIGSFGDLGLSNATIQRAEITHQQVSTLFWINLAVSLLISAIVAALAPGIAWFYHEPRLTGITLATAGGIVFGGLTTQHYALLMRQMRFDVMALVQTLPALASVLVAIVLAIAGWGYWALVIGGIVGGAGTALASWIASGWRPGIPTRSSGVGPMLAFGGHLTGFNLLNYLTRNADNILIGRFLGAGPLGIYSKAYGLLMFPVQQINAPVNGVVLPALSRLQRQPDRYRRYFLRAVEGLAFIGVPIIVFAFVDARLVVLTVLGAKWLGAVAIFRLLAPAALIGTINSAPGWIFTSLGRTERQFRWAAISTPIILVGFILGLKWGAEGVAASFSITFSLCFALFMFDACRHSPIRLRDFALALFPALCASLVAANVTGVIGLHLHFTTAARLALHAGIFFAVYAAFSLAFPSGRSLVRSLVRS